MKKIQVVLTIILAFIWVGIIVLGTLSPLAQSDNVGNQFGDFGMWSAIIFVLSLFLLPLVFSVKGSEGARVALAILIGIFILGAVVIGGVAVFAASVFNLPLILITTLSGGYIILSIIWFVCLIKRRKQ